MELRTVGYSGQILYVFNKLVELSFKRGKPHNPFLVARVKALISTLEYEDESEVDTVTGIF